MTQDVGRSADADGLSQAEPEVSALRASIPSAEEAAKLYAEQMAEVPKVEAIIEGLVGDLNMCPATPRGYRAAAEIRNSIFMWQDMRERMLAYAATVAPASAIEARSDATAQTGAAEGESAVAKPDAPTPHPQCSKPREDK